MTPDELKSLPKGTFVVMKTGFYPMKVKLKLFFDWGIRFEKLYEVEENSNRKVHYANRWELLNNIIETYCPQLLEEPQADTEFEEALSLGFEIMGIPRTDYALSTTFNVTGTYDDDTNTFMTMVSIPTDYTHFTEKMDQYA